MFCEKCGRKLYNDDIMCPLCQNPVRQSEEENVFIDNIKFEEHDIPKPYSENAKSSKSRQIAGFLQIFLGALGIGRFYLGYTAMGILQIAVGLVTCGMGSFIWGFIDGVRILNGYVNKDAKGHTLSD